MKSNELKRLIREEVKNIINEGTPLGDMQKILTQLDVQVNKIIREFDDENYDDVGNFISTVKRSVEQLMGILWRLNNQKTKVKI